MKHAVLEIFWGLKLIFTLINIFCDFGHTSIHRQYLKQARHQRILVWSWLQILTKIVLICIGIVKVFHCVLCLSLWGRDPIPWAFTGILKISPDKNWAPQYVVYNTFLVLSFWFNFITLWQCYSSYCHYKFYNIKNWQELTVYLLGNSWFYNF